MSEDEEDDQICDGRLIAAVCEYASTCDGCGDLTMHVELRCDPDDETDECDEFGFGYCISCRPDLFEE